MTVTPKREFRCEDEVWDPAKAKALRLQTNLSRELRRMLRDWVAEPDR